MIMTVQKKVVSLGILLVLLFLVPMLASQYALTGIQEEVGNSVFAMAEMRTQSAEGERMAQRWLLFLAEFRGLPAEDMREAIARIDQEMEEHFREAERFRAETRLPGTDGMHAFVDEAEEARHRQEELLALCHEGMEAKAREEAQAERLRVESEKAREATEAAIRLAEGDLHRIEDGNGEPSKAEALHQALATLAATREALDRFGMAARLFAEIDDDALLAEASGRFSEMAPEKARGETDFSKPVGDAIREARDALTPLVPLSREWMQLRGSIIAMHEKAVALAHECLAQSHKRSVMAHEMQARAAEETMRRMEVARMSGIMMLVIAILMAIPLILLVSRSVGQGAGGATMPDDPFSAPTVVGPPGSKDVDARLRRLEEEVARLRKRGP